MVWDEQQNNLCLCRLWTLEICFCSFEQLASTSHSHDLKILILWLSRQFKTSINVFSAPQRSQNAKCLFWPLHEISEAPLKTHRNQTSIPIYSNWCYQRLDLIVVYVYFVGWVWTTIRNTCSYKLFALWFTVFDVHIIVSMLFEALEAPPKQYSN